VDWSVQTSSLPEASHWVWPELQTLVQKETHWLLLQVWPLGQVEVVQS
jgi:hypothetical protein